MPFANSKRRAAERVAIADCASNYAAGGGISRGRGETIAVYIGAICSYIVLVSKTAVIRSRIESDLKSEVESILSRLGLTSSDAIQLLFRQIQIRRGIPFDVAIPNALTAKTLKESRKG